MQNIYTWISHIQAPIASLPTKHTLRLWVIVLYKEQFLMLRNTTVGYNNITSFPNTTLSENKDEMMTEQSLTERAKELIITRTWYIDMEYRSVLPTTISRTFHKPDKNYNEKWIYKRTILIFDLLSLNNIWTDSSQVHSSERYSHEELSTILRHDGTKGSSALMYQAYNDYISLSL